MMTGTWRLELLWSVPRRLRDGRLEHMAAEAESAAGWYVARTRTGLSVSAWVTTDHPDRELGRIVEHITAWLERYVTEAHLVSLRACTEAEAQAELARPDLPPLASVADAAQILGVTRERVQQWRTESRAFPAPVARVAAGPLWTVESLRYFRRSLER
jgi:hypothetical protein